MTVTILYFAWVREAVGTGEERLALPDHVLTISTLIDWLVERGDGHARAFADRSRIRAALDGELVPLETAIDGAREVALFPPVTGG